MKMILQNPYDKSKTVIAVFAKIIMLFIYIFLLIKFASDTDLRTIISPVNLLIHECGHLFFFWAGETISFLGGTFFQLGVPLLTLFIFLKQNDYFGANFSLVWTSVNLFDVGNYIADARSQSIDLFSTGLWEPIHDWNFLLSKFGLLEMDQTISKFVISAGFITLIVSIIMGVTLVFKDLIRIRDS